VNINNLWIAANIIFDLETGKTTQVLMFVTRESDASYFKKEDAEAYLQFVKQRAPKDIQWSVNQTNQRTGMFVIQGVQHVF
jgi:hypothetical protein